MIKNLKENPLSLKELDYKNLYYGKAYIYVNQENASLHLIGEIICTELKIGERVFLKYLYPNHIFLYKNKENTTDGLKISRVKNETESEISISLTGFSKYFDLEPLPPYNDSNKSSGAIKEVIPYKFDGIIGWLINIEEFQPKIPI